MSNKFRRTMSGVYSDELKIHLIDLHCPCLRVSLEKLAKEVIKAKTLKWKYLTVIVGHGNFRGTPVVLGPAVIRFANEHKIKWNYDEVNPGRIHFTFKYLRG